MTAFSRPILIPVWLIPIVFLAVAISLFQPSVSSQPKVLDWTLVAITSATANPVVRASSGDGELLPVPPNMPEPPRNACQDVAEITGQPCRWEIRAKDAGPLGIIITVILRSGEAVMGRAEIVLMEVREIVEPAMVSRIPQQVLNSRAWVSAIDVARWLQGEGFGRAMWKASETVAKTYSVRFGIDRALYAFVDAAGWGERLMKDVPSQLIEFTDKTGYWLYWLR